MLPFAHRVRTSLVLAGAAGSLLVALLLHPRPSTQAHPDDVADDGFRLSARLASTKILPGAMDHDLAITITAPGERLATRPPLSLAIVIDRSGSMSDSDVAQPMSNAKAAAARLVQQLDDNDAFAIVTYSSGDETVTGMVRATPAAKAAAQAAIARIEPDGGTCISCGLARGAGELARTPITGGVARLVLISDGQANVGVVDRDELAQLAADTAAKGVSITALGVGLDFDEVTMARLATVGRGNYYFVEDTQALGDIFRRELDGLGETIAADVRLVITEAPGTRIEEAYGYPLSRSGDHVIIPIADLRAGETRKVVVRTAVAPASTGPASLARVVLGWRRVADGVARQATTAARVEIVDDIAEVAASTDPATVQIIEQALTARALDEATAVYETHGSGAALQVLERRAAAVRGNAALDPAASERLQRASEAAIETIRTAPPARARKVNRVEAYQLAR